MLRGIFNLCNWFTYQLSLLWLVWMKLKNFSYFYFYWFAVVIWVFIGGVKNPVGCVFCFWIIGLYYVPCVLWFSLSSYLKVYSLQIRESGEPSKRKSYLPAEKQYLITRNGEDVRLSIVYLFLLDFWVHYLHFFQVLWLGFVRVFFPQYYEVLLKLWINTSVVPLCWNYVPDYKRRECLFQFLYTRSNFV